MERKLTLFELQVFRFLLVLAISLILIVYSYGDPLGTIYVNSLVLIVPFFVFCYELFKLIKTVLDPSLSNRIVNVKVNLLSSFKRLRNIVALVFLLAFFLFPLYFPPIMGIVANANKEKMH